MEKSQEAFGWAARDSSGALSPFHFTRRTNGTCDVTIKVLYCGMCHTDLHMVKNEFGLSYYPMVPGHEMVGEVIEAGSEVHKFKISDKVGVGPFCRACRTCEQCKQDLESYCPKAVPSFYGIDSDGSFTYGGFSDKMVVDEHYAFRIPDSLPLAATAPLLCGGITVYSPMQYFGLNKPGIHVGIVGLGGLGHLALKFAKAFGMKVTAISTSPGKQREAMERLGADAFLNSGDEEQMKAAMGSMEGIIDTVPAPHPVAPLIDLLKANGKLVILGPTIEAMQVPTIPMLKGRKLIAGSRGGGMKETQEMIDFAAKHNITADIEVISMDYVNTAMERLAKGDVKYRFVIDVANSLRA